MCYEAVDGGSFLIVHCPDKYITQKCVMKLLIIL